MTAWLMGQALPWIVGAIAAFGAAFGLYLKWRGDGRAKAQQDATRARLKAVTEIRKDTRDAETQDDPALVDRLTRR